MSTRNIQDKTLKALKGIAVDYYKKYHSGQNYLQVERASWEKNYKSTLSSSDDKSLQVVQEISVSLI